VSEIFERFNGFTGKVAARRYFNLGQIGIDDPER
jgi:hypothetical protein